MEVLKVSLPDHTYEIQIGPGLLQDLGKLAQAFAPAGSTIPLISDHGVWACCGEKARQALARCGFTAAPILVLPGEESKSLAVLGDIYHRFADLALTRTSLVIALGGGVIGDLCGFAAATYLRGLPYLQVPTTLLAQVDAAVGGKTALNLPQGKNLVGAFHHPQAVLMDTALLDTLPPREFTNGLAEVVKYGAICSLPLFARLEKRVTIPDLPPLIRECCRIKSQVVADDPRDLAGRLLLNFGHTFGHALEKQENYLGLKHGEAVAVGMVMAAVVGEILAFTQPGTARRLRDCLQAQGLDTAHRQIKATELLQDKKRSAAGLHLILLQEIGRAQVVKLSLAQVAKALEEVADRWPK